MRREHFKGVLWPRGKDSAGNFRYTIVGILVTDRPLDLPEEFSNESIIEGNAAMADGIEIVNKRKPNFPLGDASNALLSLKDV